MVVRGTRRCSRRLTTSTSLSSMRPRQPLGKSVAKWAMLVPSTSERVCLVLLERLTATPPARHGELNDFCYLVDHLKESLQKVVKMLDPTARFSPSLAQLLVEAASQCINPVPTQRPGSQALVGKEAPPQQPVDLVSPAKWRGDQYWHRERVLRVHGNSTQEPFMTIVSFDLIEHLSRARQTLTEGPVHWLTLHFPQRLATEWQSCGRSGRAGT